MYIIDNEAIHIAGNGARIAFYLEGISTPIKMSNIEKITKEIEYTENRSKNRIYSWLREKFSIMMSIETTGNKNSQYGT